MSNAAKQPEEWQSCEPGFLVALSERTKSLRRRRNVLRAGAGVAVLVLGAGVGLWGFWSAPREAYFGGIACHEVQENLPALVAGTLPDEMRLRMEAHLRDCPMCREMMQKMQGEQTVMSARHGCLGCECPECRRHVAVALAVNSLETQVRGAESRQQLALAREL